MPRDEILFAVGSGIHEVDLLLDDIAVHLFNERARLDAGINPCHHVKPATIVSDKEFCRRKRKDQHSVIVPQALVADERHVGRKDRRRVCQRDNLPLHAKQLRSHSRERDCRTEHFSSHLRQSGKVQRALELVEGRRLMGAPMFGVILAQATVQDVGLGAGLKLGDPSCIPSF